MANASTATIRKEDDHLDERSPLNKQLNISLSDEQFDLIDLEIEKMEKQNPGLKVSRSEMGRMLLLRGLNNVK